MTLPLCLYPPRRTRNRRLVFLAAMRGYAQHLANLAEHCRVRP